MLAKTDAGGFFNVQNDFLVQVVQEHMKKYSVAHGALIEDRHLVDTHGQAYTDPLALMGMTLENYAHFLVGFVVQ